MGRLKWYKRDPSAALNGMMELSLEQRGAYNTVLDLIYSRDGNLPDDDRFIAGWLRVDVRVWKRLKSELIDRGKLFLADGNIRNERADVEVLAALSRVASAQDAGRASAHSRALKSSSGERKNNNLDGTDVTTTASTTVSTNHNHNQKEEEPIGSPSISREPMKRRASETNERAQGINPRSTGRNPRRMKADEPITLPDWIPSEQWNGFLEMRKRKGASPTARALKLIIGKLEEMRKQGHDPGRVLDQSTVKNWTDVYPMKDQPNGNRPFTDQPRDTRDHFQRYLDRELEQCAAERAAGEAGRSNAEPPADLLRIPDRTAEP